MRRERGQTANRRQAVAIAASALSVVLFLGASGARAETGCPAPGGVLGSELWEAFSRIVEQDYLLPRGLDATVLSPRQWAKILGHGLSRQARHVGQDPERRTLFACLEGGVAQALTLISEAHRDLPGYSQQSGTESLNQIAREAMIGFYDDEISDLNGVGPEDRVRSIFDQRIGIPQSLDPGAERRVEKDAKVAAPAEPGRCRFNIHPSLYTPRHPTFEWVLIRQPLGRGGFYYDTVELNPDWPPDHPKRPVNRLKPDQKIVARGTKETVLERIRELRKSCS